MQADWTLAAALLGGTTAMRAAGQAHLPKWPNEDDKAYECRRKVAVLFPAYQRTVSTLTGKPFSKPITLGDDVPPKIVEWLQDADLQGRNLDTFASDVMESALGYGICGILVDYPKAQGVRTQADESAQGLRPYLIHIKPEQVLGWRAERVNGEWRLVQLRLMESVDEEDGEYGQKTVDQVRVLRPGLWETHRKDAKTDTWVLFEQGATTLDFIPYISVYGGRTGFMTATPPLIEVAHLNVAHWQSASDQQTILHVARVPILTVIGVDDEKFELTVGASAAVKLPLGGDMKFVEHTGAAIEAGANELDKLEERMRQAGAELLVLSPGKVTATQVATENAVGMCALQRIVQGLEDALDQALQIMAKWVGMPEGGHVTLFNDFGSATLAESLKDVLLMPVSDETKFEEAQRRGILSPDRKWEDERDRIDAQGPPLGTIGANEPAVA